MMSYMTSAAWSHPVLSLCCTEHGSYRGAVMSGRITFVAMYMSGQLGRYCTIEPHCSGMHARLAGTSITHERALKTREPSCVPRAVKPFFIPVVHSPSGPWNTWKHRSSPLRKAEPGAMRHMAAPELTSSRRQGLKPKNTWQCRSSPQQGGVVRGRGTHGDTRAHLCRKVWSEATVYVTTRGCTPCSLSWLRTCMRGYPVFRVRTILSVMIKYIWYLCHYVSSVIGVPSVIYKYTRCIQLNITLTF
jgi:hypothetical protein